MNDSGTEVVVVIVYINIIIPTLPVGLTKILPQQLDAEQNKKDKKKVITL